MSSAVLDASAVLALLRKETGHELVEDYAARGAAISAVNVAEVAAKLADGGMPEQVVRETIRALGLEVIDFDREQAYQCGLLRPLTRSADLSLGDRACLALGLHLGLAVLTTDRAWAALSLGFPITITVIR